MEEGLEIRRAGSCSWVNHNLMGSMLRARSLMKFPCFIFYFFAILFFFLFKVDMKFT